MAFFCQKQKEEEMPAKIYKVTLAKEEREELTALVGKGKGQVRRLRRARILLMADESKKMAAGKMRTLQKLWVPTSELLNEHGKSVWKWA